jgi:hypothetical protein
MLAAEEEANLAMKLAEEESKLMIRGLDTRTHKLCTAAVCGQRGGSR